MTDAAAEGVTPSSSATPDAVQDPAVTANAVTPGDDIGEAARRTLAALRNELRTTTERLSAERDAALARVQEYEDATGTETEQLRSKLGRADKDIALLKAELAVERRRSAATAAASKYGIPEFAERLQGETPEELDEDAKTLSERLLGGTARTTPDLGAGARQGVPEPSGMDALIRRKAGRG